MTKDKIKQKVLTFKYSFRREDMPHSPNTWGLDSVIPQIELKESALKKGYLVKEVRSRLVIITECIAAKANWSKAERIKRQKEIEKLPPTRVINLVKEKKSYHLTKDELYS